MRRKRTIICAALAALLLIAAFPLAAGAEDDTVIDMDRRGSIEIILLAGERPIKDAELRIYRIADIGVTGYNYSYEFVPEFAGCGVDVADIFADGTPLVIADYVEEHELIGKTALTNGGGSAMFPDMGVGVYLVINTEYLEDYMSIQPFIASVPMMSEDGTVWVYDINARPKMQTTESCPKKITVKKIWNDKSDAAKKRPTEIKVNLFRGDKLYDTTVLSEANGWSHTFEQLPIEFVWRVEEDEDALPEGYTAEYSHSDSYNYVITNTYKEKLVQTGQLNWPVPVLAVGGLLLIALGLVALVVGGKKKA